MLVLTIPSLFGLFTISFPRLYLLPDKILIERKCLIDKFSQRDYFTYKDIENVSFSPGRTDWLYIIVTTLVGSGGPGGNSKADQMVVKTIDGKRRIFNRFGKKSEFKNTIKLISKQVNRSIW